MRATFGEPGPEAAVPGETVTCTLTVENTGDTPEDVRVDLVGDVLSWGWVTPAFLNLAPGATQSVAVNLRLPKTGGPSAGPLPVTASVVATSGAAPPVPATTMLEVAPSVDIHTGLRPHTSLGRIGRHHQTIENRGKNPLSAMVEGRAEALSVRAEPPRVQLGPGQSTETEVTVRAGRRLFRGGGTRAFELVVTPEGAGAAHVAEGAIEVPAGGWAARVAAILLVLALAGLTVRATVGSGSSSPSGSATATTAGGATTASSTCPGKGHLSPDANGIVRPGVQPVFDYSFLFVSADGCQPARFNPCAPVRYLLNRTLATDADVADLTAALAKVSAATGLDFQYAGTSTENPINPARPVPDAGGVLTWPPVLIGWAHLGNGDSLRPPTIGPPTSAGSAGAGVVGGGGRPLVSNNVITTGNLVLNLDAVTDTDTHNPVPHGFGSGVNWGRIMMHELAHVIGLGHVESRTSIMNETLTQQTISSSDFGVGDAIGLRYLGKDGGCLTVPPLAVR